MVWVVVNWGGNNATFSQQLLTQVTDQLLALGQVRVMAVQHCHCTDARGWQDVGIYSSPSMWASTVGSTWQSNTSFPLWCDASWRVRHVRECDICCRYSNDDNDQSFDDFEPFGGWTQPFVKVCMRWMCDCVETDVHAAVQPGQCDVRESFS